MQLHADRQLLAFPLLLWPVDTVHVRDIQGRQLLNVTQLCTL